MTSDWWPELLSEEMAFDTPEVLQHSADPSSHGRRPQSAQMFDDAEQSALLSHQEWLSQQSQMSNAYQQYGYWYGSTQDQRYVMSGDVSLTPSLFPPQYRQEEPLPTACAAYPAVSQMRHVPAPPVGQMQTPQSDRPSHLINRLLTTLPPTIPVKCPQALFWLLIRRQTSISQHRLPSQHLPATLGQEQRSSNSWHRYTLGPNNLRSEVAAQ